MSKEIEEKENSVQILETEEDHRGYALKATFDGETFRKIQGCIVLLFLFLTGLRIIKMHIYAVKTM